MSYGLVAVTLTFVCVTLVEQNDAALPSVCALKKGKCSKTMFVYCDDDGDNSIAPRAFATTNLPTCEDWAHEVGASLDFTKMYDSTDKSLSSALQCDNEHQKVMCATIKHPTGSNGKLYWYPVYIAYVGGAFTPKNAMENAVLLKLHGGKKPTM